MSVIDEVIAANEIYSQTHELRKLTPRPERKLAVVTCMDTRLSICTLGLKTGDAHILRNAGGIVTDDTLCRLDAAFRRQLVMLFGLGSISLWGMCYSVLARSQARTRRL